MTISNHFALYRCEYYSEKDLLTSYVCRGIIHTICRCDFYTPRLTISYKMPLAIAERRLAVLLVLLTLWIPACAAQHTYDVYPMCPTTNKECLTLSGIVREMDKYFTSDVTLVFHPGDHSLQGEVVFVANVSRLTLQGSTTSSSSGAQVVRVLCDNSSLYFSGVSDLLIVSINFVSCRSMLSFTVSVFQDCSFANSTAVNCGAMAVNKGSNATFLGRTVFTGNIAIQDGGAICVNDSIIAFSGKTTFAVNHAYSYYGLGGAVYAEEHSILSFSGNSSFDSNTAGRGGAVCALQDNTLSFSGNSSFESNIAYNRGAALFAGLDNTLNFNGSSSFERNTAYNRGGALCVVWGNILNFNGNSGFEGNTAGYYGGALSADEANTFSFIGNSHFKRNAVNGYGGGGLFLFENNNLSFIGNSIFERNAASTGSGGALYAYHNNMLRFRGNSNFARNKAGRTGGSLGYFYSCNVLFVGETTFSSNTAVIGGAIYAVNSITNLTGSSVIGGNNAAYGGGVFVQGGRITFQGAGNCFKNNASQDGHGGAILAIDSMVEFSGYHQLVSNAAGFGGGIALVGIKDRTLVLEPTTNLSFTGNVAYKRGGALYVEDNPFTYCIFNTTVATEADVIYSCFMQFYDHEQHVWGVQLLKDTTGIQFNYNLNFENNTALESGDILYGGDLDSCGVYLNLYHETYAFQGSIVFGQVSNANMSSRFEVSSDPYKVCLCENNLPNCNQTIVNVHVFPGHMMSLALVTVGQMDGVAPSRVIRAVTENLKITPDFRITQPAENKSCSELHYPLLSKETLSARLELYSDEPCSTSGLPLTVEITFLPCPVGFTLSEQGSCICHTRLQKYTQACVIQNLTINREQGDSFWVGIENTSSAEGLILHPHCPFDYCTEEAVNFTLNRTDLECFSGRSGVLCGACQSGYSLALGNSRCLSGCSNKSLALLLAFAAAGVVLVAFLFFCRLTVAEGTLSGLVFYANVVAVNQSIFFPAGTTNVLTVFIAWLNLDLGIEMCFFVGLDTYSRTWLQFAFPIYVWMLVGLVIYLANVSTTFARIIGTANPVAVLATLFLLSYTKLLRATMAAFSFTTLDFRLS